MSNYAKPMVTIELAEYQELKQEAEQKEKDARYVIESLLELIKSATVTISGVDTNTQLFYFLSEKGITLYEISITPSQKPTLQWAVKR